MADSSEEVPTIATALVATKFKRAATAANTVLKELVEKCAAGTSVLELCVIGDQRILQEVEKACGKKKKEKNWRKGIAFPTCVSINDCICHYSPLRSEKNPPILKDGDVVKIDLGAHIDGFPAVVAHTFIVGASPTNKVSGRKADAILAAHYAVEAALRKFKGGINNYEVTETIQKVAEEFKCQPVQGMLSHQLMRDKIDGEKAIILNPTPGQRKDHPKSDFEPYEVYALDVLVSTGEGKTKELDTRTTVYQRKDIIYQLKLKASRAFFNEMNKKFEMMPFTLRGFDDENKARLGVNECAKHMVVEPFPVLYEKQSKEVVAQIKCTVFVEPSGATRITQGPFDDSLYETENSIQDAGIKELLATPVSNKDNSNKEESTAANAETEAAPSS